MQRRDTKETVYDDYGRAHDASTVELSGSAAEVTLIVSSLKVHLHEARKLEEVHGGTSFGSVAIEVVLESIADPNYGGSTPEALSADRQDVPSTRSVTGMVGGMGCNGM